MARLSLIVLSFRRFEQTTGPCLDTLLPQSKGVELLLVDNGSDDGAAERCAELAARHANLRYLPQARNLGFGGGMNAGVAQSYGDWVVLVNSDTLFPEGAVAALQRAVDHAPDDVALLGPVTNAAGNGQCLPLSGLSHAQVLQVGAKAMQQPTGLLSPTYRSDFFCIAIRRTAWDALNGLDPVFGLGYYEDFDFSLRARAAGFDQRIAEDVFIAHVGSATFSAQREEQRLLLRKNRALLKQRHAHVHFDHEREGNLSALTHIIEIGAQHGWTEALKARASWRAQALLDRAPRSLFKRLRWSWRVRAVLRQLAAAGVQPHYPPMPNPLHH